MALTDLLGKASGVFGGMGGGGQFGDEAGGATSGVTGTTYTSGGLQIGAKNVGSGSASTAQSAGGNTGPMNAGVSLPAWVLWGAGLLALGAILYALLRRK
jgi:hypothetical protein